MNATAHGIGRHACLWGFAMALAACGGPQLHPAIAREYAPLLRNGDLAPPRYCGSLVEIRMNPARIADAAPSYYDNATGALVVRCDNPLATRDIAPADRTICPPPDWRCGD